MHGSIRGTVAGTRPGNTVNKLLKRSNVEAAYSRSDFLYTPTKPSLLFEKRTPLKTVTADYSGGCSRDKVLPKRVEGTSISPVETRVATCSIGLKEVLIT